VIALVQTALTILLTASMMDGGETLRLTLVAVLLFWGWIFVAMYRRPDQPTAADLIAIRWGTIPFVICFVLAVRIVWSWRGLSRNIW
jgi:hypothetical protein